MIGIIIGVRDIIRLTKQDKYLAQFPIGDIGEYIIPKKILGVKNYVFPSSFLIIAIIAIIKKIKS